MRHDLRLARAIGDHVSYRQRRRGNVDRGPYLRGAELIVNGYADDRLARAGAIGRGSCDCCGENETVGLAEWHLQNARRRLQCKPGRIDVTTVLAKTAASIFSVMPEQ